MDVIYKQKKDVISAPRIVYMIYTLLQLTMMFLDYLCVFHDDWYVWGARLADLIQDGYCDV